MKKILIITTLPEMASEASRSYRTYFYQYPKENIATFFVSDVCPDKGVCSTFYKLTDKIMCSLSNKVDGQIFLDSDVKENIDHNTHKRKINNFHIKRFIRKFLWRGDRWKTDKLYSWIATFSPDCIFLTWHYDVFLLQIAQTISSDFDLPIYSTIGDDYFLSRKKVPFSIGRKHYNNVAFKILKNQRNKNFFISDKMREDYHKMFGINGTTIHVCNDTIHRQTTNVGKIKTIGYFGNLSLGRFESLIRFSKSLISNVKITVCSGTTLSKRQILEMKKYNIEFLGKKTYDEIIKLQENLDSLLLLEELYKKKNIKQVQYSLSTKVGDSLSLGKPIVIVGNTNTGLVDYFRKKNLGFIFDENYDFRKGISMDFDIEKILKDQRTCLQLAETDFEIKNNSTKFMETINDC